MLNQIGDRNDTPKRRQASLVMEAFIYFVSGAALLAGGVVAKSLAVFLLGAYYFSAIPLSAMLGHDKGLWHWTFAMLNFALAGFLFSRLDPVLSVAAFALFTSACVTVVAHLYGGFADANYGPINWTLMVLVVFPALAYGARLSA